MTWFGFHELFHAATLLAFGAQFTAVAIAVAAVPVRDPLAVIGVGGGRGVVGHRTRFGLWDGSRLPTSTGPVAIGSHAELR